MFLKTVAGEYQPAYFIIRIDSDEPPEDLVEANEATFLHEYLHLLQDLVLPYCMRENIARVEIFLSQIKNARQQGELHLPSEYSDDDIRLVTQIGKVTWGGSSSHSGVDRIDRIDMLEVEVSGKEYKLQKYTLAGGAVRDYHFGARDLLEYIASKIEFRHFPAQAQPPDLPYRSIDLVLAYEDLSYLSDVKRIALAEYCLLNDNPARRLMVLIEDIKKGLVRGVDRASDDEFVTYLSNLQWSPNGAPFRTIEQKLQDRYEQLKGCLQDQFPKAAFPAIYEWLDRALLFAQEVLAGRSLFAVLFEMDTPGFKASMSSVISRLGIPLLANRHHSLGTSLGDSSSKDQFIQLLLAYEFAEYLKQNETTCPLYAQCEADNPSLIDDDDCLNAPFRRAQRQALCPFGVFAKGAGLGTVRWYTKGRLIPSWRSDPFAEQGGPP
jgi:hypothetical protein